MGVPRVAVPGSVAYPAPVDKARTPLLVTLIVVNLVVLLGQLWPEGAPPFARAVNIAFLVASALTFTAVLLRKV